MPRNSYESIVINKLTEQAIPFETKISAGGSNVAIRVTEFRRDKDEKSTVAHIFNDLDAESPNHRTSIKDANNLRWAKDSEQLGFISTRSPRVGFGLKSGTSQRYDNPPEGFSDTQVWSLDFKAGGPPKQLTALEEPVAEFDWSPDGDRLVVVTARLLKAELPGPDVETTDASRTHHDPENTTERQVRYQLRVIDLNTHSVTTLNTASDTTAHHRYWYRQMSPRWVGDRIVYTASEDNDGIRNIHSIAPDGTDHRQHTDANGTALFPEISPDTETIGYVQYHDDRRFKSADVCVVSMDAIRTKPTVLSDTLDRYVQYVEWCDEETLLGLVGTDGSTHFYTFGVDGLVEEFYTPDRTTASIHRSGGTRPFDVHRDSGRVVAIRNGPNIVSLITLGSDIEGIHTVREFNDGITDSSPMVTRELSVTSEDGVPIDAFLYEPPEGEGPFPTILDIARSEHGYKTPRYRFRHQYWTSRGYSVLKVNPRGSVSYGERYASALHGNYGELDVLDVTTVLEHAVETDTVETDSIFGFGHVYGAVLILNVLAKTDLLAAGVVQHGTYYPQIAYGNDNQKRYWQTLLGDPASNRKAYEQYSPMSNVDSIDAPVLILAGKEDSRSTPEMARTLHERLVDTDTQVETVVYDGLGRTNLGPREVAIDRLKRTTAWYDEHR